MAWARDGRIVYQQRSGGELDLRILPATGASPESFQQVQGSQTHPQVSPDGRWLAYGSGETGRAEIYVRSFPDGARKWLATTAGGGIPRWRGDGRELFFLSGTLGGGRLGSVEIRVEGNDLKMSSPQSLFDSEYGQPGPDFGGTTTPTPSVATASAFSFHGCRPRLPTPANASRSSSTGPRRCRSSLHALAVFVRWHSLAMPARAGRTLRAEQVAEEMVP